MEGSTYLGKVTGADPERFAMITMQPDRSGIRKVSFFTESEFREFSQANGKPGLTERDIDAMIENARKHLV
jgi:hypothetical protein